MQERANNLVEIKNLQNAWKKSRYYPKQKKVQLTATTFPYIKLKLPISLIQIKYEKIDELATEMENLESPEK